MTARPATAKPSAQARRKRHEQAADWFMRNQASPSPQDAQKFANWLARDPDNQVAYRAAERLMADAHGAILSDAGLRDFKVRPRSAKPVVALLLALGLVGGGFLLADGPMRMQADAMSRTGEMPVLTLADGSVMQLNAHSAVAYDFTPDARVVRLLRGEAFFQVTRDAQRPFTVEAGGGRVTALGTAFDVRLGDYVTDVVVTEHAVALAASRSDQTPTELRENHSASYGADGRAMNVKPADTLARLAWRRGQLVVDNATLADVVAELGRHFSGRIVIGSAGLAERRVSGTFSIIDTEAALAFITQALDVNVTRIGPLILIRG